MYRSCLLSFLLISMSPNCFSTTGNSGIQFLKSQAIAIERQDITLKPNKVINSYVFINNSVLDRIETLVLPVLEEKQNLTITANRVNIDYKTLTRAINYNGVDITNTLKSLNVPINPKIAATFLAKDTTVLIRDKLQKLEILDYDSKPNWNTKSYYYWQQKFPVAKEVHIQQSYTPKLELVNPDFIDMKNKPQNSMIKNIWKKIRKKATLNLDSNEDKYNNINTLSNLDKNETKVLNFSFSNDNIWNGPSKYFTLKIENVDNDKIFIDWPEKFTPNSYNSLLFVAENFIPTQDISILLPK